MDNKIIDKRPTTNLGLDNKRPTTNLCLEKSNVNSTSSNEISSKK